MERRLAAAQAAQPVAFAKTGTATVVVAAVSAAAEESEGEVAAASIVEITPGAPDGDGPQWPDDAAETAFLSEQRTNGPAVLPQIPSTLASSAAQAEPPEVANAPLPPLQSLVDRIPAEAREVLDELFRARFVSVKRVQTNVLK